MKRWHLIALALVFCAGNFWLGFVCGIDAAHLDLSCDTDMDCMQRFGGDGYEMDDEEREAYLLDVAEGAQK